MRINNFLTLGGILIMSSSSRVILAAGVLALVACHGSLSPVEGSGYGIETAVMYEQLGITDEVRAQLSSGDCHLVDSLLIYDGQEKLLARRRVQSDVLGHVSLSVPDLTDGTYTFVLFQTCTQDGEQGCWMSVNAGQLASLQLRPSDSRIDGIQALGVVKGTVSVRKGAIDVDLTPRAVGAIVDFQVDNVAKDSSPLWLYITSSVSGFYPGSGDYKVGPKEKKALGCLEKGQSNRRFFMLADGSEVTASVQTGQGFVYFEDSLSIPPGNNAACYYCFAPKGFFNAYFGTQEGAAAFKALHEGDNCTLHPCLQWGASMEDVDFYVKNRQFISCGEGNVFAGNGFTGVRYQPAPGLAEECFFDTEGKLIEVTYLYDGAVYLDRVQSCMEEQGFKYMGYFLQEYVLIYSLYVSADEQTELVTYPLTDILLAEGHTSWAATFLPFNSDDLGLIEFQ